MTGIEGGQVHLHVVDPSNGGAGWNLRFDPAAWLVDYFTPVVDLVEQSGPRFESGLLVAELSGTDLEIGLPQEVAAAVAASRRRGFDRRPRRTVAVNARTPIPLLEQADPEDRAIVEPSLMRPGGAVRSRMGTLRASCPFSRLNPHLSAIADT